MSETPDTTALLIRMSQGDREALDALVPLVYGELRRLAHQHLRREDDGHTLNTTALVHEAYVRLVDVERVQWRDRSHFCAMASRMMRRILINYAKMRKRDKRGGSRARVPLQDRHLVQEQDIEDLLALDQALSRLAESSERMCRVVECRFFGGLTIDETAEALGVSVGTVKNDWRLARAWLNQEIGPGSANRMVTP